MWEEETTESLEDKLDQLETLLALPFEKGLFCGKGQG